MTRPQLFNMLSLGALLLFAAGHVHAAPGSCKGPNKNDPGCNEVVTPSTAAVDSVTVDWANERLIVRGSGFTGSSEFLLGGSATPLGTASVTGTELMIPFDAGLAAEVTSRGSYNLLVDGAVQLAVFVESQIVDPAAVGCPCATGWDAALGSLWGAGESDCVEIEGPETGDVADIGATVLSNPFDTSVYPHYPVGASFYPGDPERSVCRLVQVNADASAIELVNERVNETQQADCAAVLRSNICVSP